MRGFSQRSIEELAKAESNLGPGGAPRRPRGWLGASSVLGFVLVIVLLVLMADRTDPGDEPPVSPTPSHGAVASLVLPGYASGAVADR